MAASSERDTFASNLWTALEFSERQDREHGRQLSPLELWAYKIARDSLITVRDSGRHFVSQTDFDYEVEDATEQAAEKTGDPDLVEECRTIVSDSRFIYDMHAGYDQNR